MSTPLPSPQPAAATPPKPLKTLIAGIFLGSDDQDLGVVLPGNATRARSRWVAMAFFAALCMVQAWKGRIPYAGVFVATALALAMVAALLDHLGTFDDAPPTELTERPSLAPRMWALGAGLVGTWAGLWLGSHGIVPPFAAGAVLTLAFSSSVYAAHRVISALCNYANADDRMAPLRSYGVWLLLLAGLINLPGLGVSSLWDPWETHYGLVAREVLARDDWITLWSTQEGEAGKWFWSKPVLNFWAQALSMDALGVGAEADMMLKNAFGHYTARPEWAVRAPGALLMIGAAFALYKAVANVFGARSGFFAGLVLLTMPDWFFISHQTMADTGFVGALVVSMSLMLLGLNTPAEQQVRRYALNVGGRTVSLSALHLVLGAWLMVTLPQISYLASRNISFSRAGLGFSWDTVLRGSTGNCNLPGNQPCESKWPALVPPELAVRNDLRAGVGHLVRGFEPVLQVLLWAGVISFVTYLLVGERRTRRLLFVAGWVFAGVATLGKGPLGLVLPIACVGSYVLVTGRWRELLDFEIPAGLSIWATVCLPWFVASYVRNGRAFVDRLILHDMINRVTSHVHDTNEGDDTSLRYFLGQLGYATFPWVVFVPLAIAILWKHPSLRDKAKQSTAMYFYLWFAMSFGFFSFMGTKFHHYIFPAVPALAALVGIAIGALYTDRKAAAGSETQSGFDATPWALVASVIAVVVGADFLHDTVHGQPGAVRLLTLFTYMYNRAWPTHINLTPALAGFVVFFALMTLAMAWERLRAKALIAMFAGSVVWASWGVDVYMVKLAPHWSQHELFTAYYTRRAGPQEPVVAFQMNWLGEYFFSSNHIAAFVTSGQAYKDWLAKQKVAGVKVIYVVCEHSRISSMKSETGAKNYEELTSKETNNKFIMVRAEL